MLIAMSGSENEIIQNSLAIVKGYGKFIRFVGKLYIIARFTFNNRSDRSYQMQYLRFGRRSL